jgi:hypothetical protein
MSDKTSYAIFLSFMALFAALAAHGSEPAAKEHAAVLSAARSGNQSDYAAALIRYSDRLSKEFAPKETAATVAKAEVKIEAPVEEAALAGAPEIELAKVEPAKVITPAEATKAADQAAELAQATKVEPVTEIKPSLFETLLASATPESKKMYAECLQTGPAECCPAVIDKHASMPELCGTYAPAANRSISSAM